MPRREPPPVFFGTNVTLRAIRKQITLFGVGRIPPFRVILASLYLIGLLAATLYLLLRSH